MACSSVSRVVAESSTSFKASWAVVLDHALGLLDVGHARELDQDLVAPVPVRGDHGLGHPELVDPALQGPDGLLHRALLDLGRKGVGHLDQEPALARLAHLPAEPEEVLQDVAHVLHPRRLDALHREGGGVHALGAPKTMPLAELVAGGLHRVVDGRVQGVVGHDLEHEVDPAPQVEAELDLAGLVRPRVGRPDRHHAGDQEGAVEGGPHAQLLADEA